MVVKIVVKIEKQPDGGYFATIPDFPQWSARGVDRDDIERLITMWFAGPGGQQRFGEAEPDITEAA